MTYAAPNVALMPSSFAPHLGGVEELSRRLALELRRRGSDTIVITNRYPKSLEAHSEVDGIPVYRERFRFPEPKPRHLAGWVVGTGATRRALRTRVRDHASEIVHVQCVSTNGYYARRLAYRARLPLVVSLQGELTMDANRIYEKSATLRRAWRKLLDQADVVTGCSQQVIDEAVAAYGPRLAHKARVVRNGVDLEAVRSAAPERRERPYLFAIGRMVAQKGFDVLLDAFGKVATEFGEHDLVLAGDGPDRAALQARAPRGRVHFLGGIAAERAFSLYSGAEGFVLPSRHEPQGIVVIEAMAAGAPVLATRVGGVPETVRDGVNGLLVRGDDVDAMADGLRRLLADRESARARAAQASKNVLDYTWQKITDEYERCYADAARERAVRHG